MSPTGCANAPEPWPVGLAPMRTSTPDRPATAPEAPMLTAIHVCAGAGGLSLGLHRAGFNVRAFDLDRVAALVHEMHVGPCAVDNLATYHPRAPADVAIGGVPCQPYSMAGARRGMKDVHGSLFEEAHGMLFEHLVRVAVGWQWPQHAGNASRLIGNAVPPALGEAVARVVATCLTR